MERMAVMAAAGGNRISLARIQKGLSMRGLASKAGLSLAAVSRMENSGTHNIRPASAKKICAALEVPFDALFVIKTPDGAGEDSGQPK